MHEALVSRVMSTVRDVPDFPKPGILFKDITPVLGDPRLFADVLHWIAGCLAGQQVDRVVGMESRGFIFGAAVAPMLHAGFVPARKPGKLPYRTKAVSYNLEYGSAALELHIDAVRPGQRVLIVDDLLATGGTAKATIDLVQALGGEVVACVFLVELDFLHGRDKLGVPVHSLVHY
jgi:adenine phosphoribosyltransferase